MNAVAMTPVEEETKTVAASLAPKAPDSWESLGSKVPKHFRAPLIDRAWKTHAEILAKLETNVLLAKPLSRVTAETTAMADINAAVFMPLHLVKESQRDEAMAVLSKGVGHLWSWLKEAYPRADVVLVVGDQPQEETMASQLDAFLEECPAKKLICGPGTGVEKMVRDYAEVHEYGAAQIGSVDERGGAGWTQTPGPKLDKMVESLFHQYQPTRVIAFEPLQMPATHQVVQKAEAIGIPITRVDAPTVRIRLQPS